MKDEYIKKAEWYPPTFKVDIKFTLVRNGDKLIIKKIFDKRIKK